MKVLLIHCFYRDYAGEDAVVDAERELLTARGHRVELFARRNAETAAYRLGDKLLLPGRMVYSHRDARDLEAAVRAFRPEVAFVHNVFPLMSPAVYHRLDRLGVPVVQTVHNFRFICPNGILYTEGRICERCTAGNLLHAVAHRCNRGSRAVSALYALTLALHRRAGLWGKVDAYLCLSAFARDKLAGAGLPTERLHLRPNFIDPGRHRPRYGEGEHALYLGSLRPHKGVWALVKAFEGLPSLPLRLAGEGPLRGPLETYLRDRGIRHITLEGFQEGAAKQDLLDRALFTVVPSEWYEGFPVVILEAYAHGKPVIASRLGSLPEIVEHEKSGLCFEPGNAGALAACARRLAGDPATTASMGAYARGLVERRYHPQAAHDRLIEVFELARERRAAAGQGKGR